jgi:hypothetical protein
MCRAALSRDRAAGGLTVLQRFVDAAAVEAEIERVRTLSPAVLRRQSQQFGELDLQQGSRASR